MEKKFQLIVKDFADQHNWKVDQCILQINTNKGYEFKGVFLTSQKRKLTFIGGIANETPKYEGGLVSLYTYKNHSNKVPKIRPLDLSDSFCPDYVFIYIQSNRFKQEGYYVFNKDILIKQGIFSNNYKGGKVAFRLWPSWCPLPQDESKKKIRQKILQWQLPHFTILS